MEQNRKTRKCRFCLVVFDVARHWQVFCGNRCKIAWHKENHNCFYCGDYYAHTRDHIHPVSARSAPRSFMGQETVICCKTCNSALGGALLEIEDRVEFLIKYYTAKYKLWKNVVVWDEEETSELGPNLKRRIKKMMALRKTGEAKVIYLQHLAEYIQDSTLYSEKPLAGHPEPF